MIRQALDQLKHQIPLLDYLQGHHWQSTGRLSRGRWMGLCPLHPPEELRKRFEGYIGKPKGESVTR